MSQRTPNQPHLEKKRPRRDAVLNTTTPADLEKEKIKELSYPIQADSRGVARVTFKRKSYSFGPFDSPQSYVKFGLWKRELLESGEPATIASLRPIVDAAMNGEPYRPPKPRHTGWFVAAVFLGLTFIATANYFGYRYYASMKPTEIDGVAMTRWEMDSIREVRKLVMPDPAQPNIPGKPTPELLRRAKAYRDQQENKAPEGNPNAKSSSPD